MNFPVFCAKLSLACLLQHHISKNVTKQFQKVIFWVQRKDFKYDIQKFWQTCHDPLGSNWGITAKVFCILQIRYLFIIRLKDAKEQKLFQEMSIRITMPTFIIHWCHMMSFWTLTFTSPSLVTKLKEWLLKHSIGRNQRFHIVEKWVIDLLILEHNSSTYYCEPTRLSFLGMKKLDLI